MRPDRALLAVLLLAAAPAPGDALITGGDELAADVSPLDGRIAIDLQHAIWLLPGTGGPAVRVIAGDDPLQSPRWSPDGKRLLYQADTQYGTRLFVADADGGEARLLDDSGFHDQDAAWHPDGERIVFASARRGTGLDLWELDVPTGLSWRLTSDPGDESEPAWSANGRHLAWVRHDADGYAIVLRRNGEPEEELARSVARLSAPSWRPDGSLLTYLQHGDEGTALIMAILSTPPLLRQVETAEPLADAPVSWIDRMHYVYTAGGGIRTRGFEDRRSRPLPFHAVVETSPPRVRRALPAHELAVTGSGGGTLIVRGARLFDGLGLGYRQDVDVIVENGRVAAIEAAAPRPDATVLDLGDVTILPGLIDAWSPLEDDPGLGARLLAWGVTTIVADPTLLSFDPGVWNGEAVPGPRLLPALRPQQLSDMETPPDVVFVVADGADESGPPADWRERATVVATSLAAARRIDADVVVGAFGAGTADGFAFISALADATTPGLDRLLDVRQSLAFAQTSPPSRRRAAAIAPGGPPSGIAAGSARSGLAPGQSLQAELLSLAAQGFSNGEALQAAGRNAARLLGLDNRLGVVVPGAAADLVLVAGDPLSDLGTLTNVVAVVRNGRFFSLVSLLERAAADPGVE